MSIVTDNKTATLEGYFRPRIEKVFEDSKEKSELVCKLFSSRALPEINDYEASELDNLEPEKFEDEGYHVWNLEKSYRDSGGRLRHVYRLSTDLQNLKSEDELVQRQKEKILHLLPAQEPGHFELKDSTGVTDIIFTNQGSNSKLDVGGFFLIDQCLQNLYLQNKLPKTDCIPVGGILSSRDYTILSAFGIPFSMAELIHDYIIHYTLVLQKVKFYLIDHTFEHLTQIYTTRTRNILTATLVIDFGEDQINMEDSDFCRWLIENDMGHLDKKEMIEMFRITLSALVDLSNDPDQYKSRFSNGNIKNLFDSSPDFFIKDGFNRMREEIFGSQEHAEEVRNDLELYSKAYHKLWELFEAKYPILALEVPMIVDDVDEFMALFDLD